MLIHKLSDEELSLLEVLEHPVWFSEFMRTLIEPSWQFADYQRSVLGDCSNYISFRAGRAVGKSTVLIDKVAYFAINDFFVTPTVAIVTPNRVHLDPLWRELVRWLTVHPFLKHFNKSINSQVFKITLANGVTIDCRIAGVGTKGQTVIGLHTPILVLDEAGYFDWVVWKELLPTLNTWETGFQLYVCGTPSGRREDNVLYFADAISDEYNHHRVSARQNPRYSDQDEKRNVEQYGGLDTDDFSRLVLGEHGSQVSQLYSRNAMKAVEMDLFTATITREDIETDPFKLDRMFASLPLKDNVATGIDLGFSADPTIISLVSKHGNSWYLFGRITLRGVEYPLQTKIIDRLDSYYKFVFLAIDEGSAGVAVSQQLVSGNEYKHKRYQDRVTPVSFSTSVTIGTDLDGAETKRPLKQLAVEKLKSLIESKRLIFALNDEKVMSELERVEAMKTPNGRYVYRVRGVNGTTSNDDHIFASLLCFAYKLYIDEDSYQITSLAPKHNFILRWRN